MFEVKNTEISPTSTPNLPEAGKDSETTDPLVFWLTID